VRALRDVNVLLALFDPDHPHHAAANLWRAEALAEGWASCPLTQNGFVRIISARSYRRPLPIEEAIYLLRWQLMKPGHVFWPDDISLSDPMLVDQGQLLGPNQITDAYLLALAVKNRGRLVTFDRSIAIGAVKGAEAKHLVTIS
jgi:toxin-antitoxin system PIN domain toxin